MQTRPLPGEIYRHFKNKLYQVITIAKHSETGEELVIYQALYEPFTVCARPLPMFVSEVDHEKYPQVTQKYRFEKVELENAQRVAQEKEWHNSGSGFEVSQNVTTVTGDTESSETNGLSSKLMAFLETEDLQERYNILVSMSDEITDSMIDTMAVVMDTVIPEGELFKRYDDLKHVIRTRQQYESANRLRL